MAITILTNSVLTDSKRVNETTLAQINLELAEFSGTPENNLRKPVKFNQEESISDELKARKRKTLKDARALWSLPSKTSQGTVLTPRRGLRQIPTGEIKQGRRTI